MFQMHFVVLDGSVKKTTIVNLEAGSLTVPLSKAG